MTSQRDVKKMKMIQFLLHKEKTTYSEIAKEINISERTVAKYLDMIEEEVRSYGVDLVRKPSDGVYFVGNTQALEDNTQGLELNLVDSKKERSLYVFSRLILSPTYVTIQQLADELYVSRSTLENVMRDVKDIFSENDTILVKNRNGLKAQLNEAQRRRLIAKLINFYWGNPNYKQSLTDQDGRSMELPPKIKELFDEQLLKGVIDTLNKFCTKSLLDVTEYEFQSLAIHLMIAIDRIKKNQYLSSALEQYRMEDNTMLLVAMLEKQFQIVMPEYEKYYINIHMLAIQKTTLEKLAISKDDSNFGIEMKELIVDALGSLNLDKEVIDGLVLHLTSAVKRLYLGLSINNPFTNEIKRNFPQAFEESLQIRQSILKQYGIEMNDEECAFIALHLGSFFERKKDNQQKINVILVCSSGVGTSRLLEQRIKKAFSHNIHITRVVSLATLSFEDISEDLIISTVNITTKLNIPIVVVSPFLYELDVQSIQREVSGVANYFTLSQPFVDLIDEELLWIENKRETKEQVIHKIGEKLLLKGYAVDGVIESAIQREELSSTAHEVIALPHAGVDFIQNSKISIYINREGIDWGEDGMLVKAVFFFAINHEVREYISKIYEFFNEFIDDKKQINRLIQVKDKEAIITILKGD